MLPAAAFSGYSAADSCCTGRRTANGCGATRHKAASRAECGAEAQKWRSVRLLWRSLRVVVLVLVLSRRRSSRWWNHRAQEGRDPARQAHPRGGDTQRDVEG